MYQIPNLSLSCNETSVCLQDRNNFHLIYPKEQVSCLYLKSQPRLPKPEAFNKTGTKEMRQFNNTIHDINQQNEQNSSLSIYYYNMTMNIRICFDPQGILIRESNQISRLCTQLSCYVYKSGKFGFMWYCSGLIL
jgi:hypothetical protein